MWFNAIGSTTSHEDVVITSFPSRYEKAAWPLLTYSLTGRQPYSFPLFHFLSLTPRFPFLLAWLELSWIFSSFRGRNYSKTILVVLLINFAAYRPNRPTLHFLPNYLIGSHLNGSHLENSSIYNRHTDIAFIPLSSLLPRGETLFLFPLNIILELNLNSEIFLRQL